MHDSDHSQGSIVERHPLWAHMLGLCPLFAVTNTLAYALGLAMAVCIVIVGGTVSVVVARTVLPRTIHSPCFVIILATFTTIAVLLMEAFAYGLYAQAALFVHVIVIHSLIVGRAEALADQKPLLRVGLDAIRTVLGLAGALILLGALRETLATGTLLADADLLFGPSAANWQVQLSAEGWIPLAQLAPGAFILAGLLIALARWIQLTRQRGAQRGPHT